MPVTVTVNENPAHIPDCYAVELEKKNKLDSVWDPESFKIINCGPAGEIAKKGETSKVWIQFKCINPTCTKAYKRMEGSRAAKILVKS